MATDSDSEFEAVSATVVVSDAVGAAVISSLTDDGVVGTSVVVSLAVGALLIYSLADEVVVDSAVVISLTVGALVISSLIDAEVVVGGTSTAAPEAGVVSMMETMVLEEAPEIRYWCFKLCLKDNFSIVAVILHSLMPIALNKNENWFFYMLPLANITSKMLNNYCEN